jgi:DNA-binding NarL/FixJ family response regulator
MYRSTNHDLNPQERTRTSFLMVESDRVERQNLKQLIGNLGYPNLSDTGKHSSALIKLGDPESRFTHVIFDSRPTDMNPADFLREALKFAPQAIFIASSSNPNLDDVFQLLVNGARGFLIKPFSLDGIDTSIIVATKGEPLATSVKEAKDRNTALASMMMVSLNKLVDALKKFRISPNSQNEIIWAREQFYSAVDLARMFAKGGEEGLMNAILTYCINKSKGPSTKLGRLRKPIKERSASEGDSSEDVSDTSEGNDQDDTETV